MVVSKDSEPAEYPWWWERPLNKDEAGVALE